MGAISELDHNNRTCQPSQCPDIDGTTTMTTTSPQAPFASLLRRLSHKKTKDPPQEDDDSSSEYLSSPASNSTPITTRPKPIVGGGSSGSFRLRSTSRARKSPSDYLRSLSPMRFRRAINPPPLHGNGDSDKHVHFADEKEGWSSGVESDKRPLVSIIETLPALTEEERLSIFWTKKEIAKMRSRSKCLAEDIAFKKDRRVLVCLEYLYESASSDHNSKESMSQMKSALEYYFSLRIAVKEGGTRCSGNHGSVPGAPLRHTTTNLRGLEHQIMVVPLADCRMSCIQAVLSLQSKLESGANKSGGESHELILARASVKASAASRRLARVLGKADEAAAKHAH